jgi:hypothetical protein
MVGIVVVIVVVIEVGRWWGGGEEEANVSRLLASFAASHALALLRLQHVGVVVYIR